MAAIKSPYFVSFLEEKENLVDFINVVTPGKKFKKMTSAAEDEKWDVAPVAGKNRRTPLRKAKSAAVRQISEFYCTKSQPGSSDKVKFDLGSQPKLTATAKPRKRLTYPKSPFLRTKQRSMKRGPCTLKSTEDMQVEEMAKLPKFKANPVRKAIMTKPRGVTRVAKKPLTVPHSPALTKPKRQLLNLRKTEANTQKRSFAKRSALQRQSFHLPGERISLLKKAKFEAKMKAEELAKTKEHSTAFKAQPIPEHDPMPLRRRPAARELTKAHPFKFETSARAKLR